MAEDPELIADTRAWLVKATSDLAAATLDLQAQPPLTEDVVFHAQQATEKALKGFLTFRGRVFRKTHNLVELGESCAALDPTLTDLLKSAARLTEYAWLFRYPGEPEAPSREEAEEALATARAVYHAILARLPAQVATP